MSKIYRVHPYRHYILFFILLYYIFLYKKGNDIGLAENDTYFKEFTYPLSRIFFGVITEPKSKRRPFVYNNWMHSILKSNFNSVKFISPLQNDYPNLYIEPIKELYNHTVGVNKDVFRDRDRAIKRITGAKFFLDNTNLEYYWTLTDDTSIDMLAATKMIRELDQKNNPFYDNVLQGHCITSLQYTYLQGGAGYLMSRPVAKLLVDHADEWLEQIKADDDFYSNSIREWAGLTYQQTASHYFLGHIIKENFEHAFKQKVYPKCNKTRDFFCGYSSSYPISDIAIIHISDLNFHHTFLRKVNALKNMNNCSVRYVIEFPIFIKFCREE